MRKKIFYHILAWIEDEGKYQPTQEEAEKAVDDILRNGYITFEVIPPSYWRNKLRVKQRQSKMK